MSEPIETIDGNGAADHFQLVAKLASFIAQPQAMMHPSHYQTDQLPDAAIEVLVTAPAFQRPFVEAVRGSLGIDEIRFSEDFVRKLDNDEKTRMAATLVTASTDELLRLSGHVAAARLHPQILRCVLKAEKQRVRRVLGEAAFSTAIREASSFYQSLAELSRGTTLHTLLDEAETKPENAAERCNLLGLQTLLMFVDMIEPQLALLLRIRIPADGAVSRMRTEDLLNTDQIQALERLLHRKGLMA